MKTLSKVLLFLMMLLYPGIIKAQMKGTSPNTGNVFVPGYFI
jgi:hypothetical protein